MTASKGVIRFAGVTVSAFQGEEALALTVRPRGKIESANLRAELEVGADLEGVAVRKDRLLPAHGITRIAPHT